MWLLLAAGLREQRGPRPGHRGDRRGCCALHRQCYPGGHHPGDLRRRHDHHPVGGGGRGHRDVDGRDVDRREHERHGAGRLMRLLMVAALAAAGCVTIEAPECAAPTEIDMKDMAGCQGASGRFFRIFLSRATEYAGLGP